MNDPTIFDLLRDRAQGRLSPAELAALERQLAADPALRELAEDYQRVHELTALDPVSTLGSRASFETLEASLAPAPRFTGRRVAAAALLLAVAGGSFLVGRWSRPGSETLLLSAIELDEPPGPSQEPDDLPLRWADYEPRSERGVSFLRDLDEAEQLARASRRPLLVYGSYPGCPLCKTLDERVFSDDSVAELIERTVPVRIDLAQLSESEQLSFTRRGYPFLEMWRDDGRTTHSLTRSPDPTTFLESLHDGLDESGATGEQPPWDEIRSVARRLVAARTAELEGRLADAEHGFRELAGGRAPDAIAVRARAGVRRLSEGARALLLEARAAASSEPAEARRLLESALERYRSTSFEADLRAALERFERDGRFPDLAEADRSSA